MVRCFSGSVASASSIFSASSRRSSVLARVVPERGREDPLAALGEVRLVHLVDVVLRGRAARAGPRRWRGASRSGRARSRRTTSPRTRRGARGRARTPPGRRPRRGPGPSRCRAPRRTPSSGSGRPGRGTRRRRRPWPSRPARGRRLPSEGRRPGRGNSRVGAGTVAQVGAPAPPALSCRRRPPECAADGAGSDPRDVRRLRRDRRVLDGARRRQVRVVLLAALGFGAAAALLVPARRRGRARARARAPGSARLALAGAATALARRGGVGRSARSCAPPGREEAAARTVGARTSRRSAPTSCRPSSWPGSGRTSRRPAGYSRRARRRAPRAHRRAGARGRPRRASSRTASRAPAASRSSRVAGRCTASRSSPRAAPSRAATAGSSRAPRAARRRGGGPHHRRHRAHLPLPRLHAARAADALRHRRRDPRAEGDRGRRSRRAPTARWRRPRSWSRSRPTPAPRARRRRRRRAARPRRLKRFALAVQNGRDLSGRLLVEEGGSYRFRFLDGRGRARRRGAAASPSPSSPTPSPRRASPRPDREIEVDAGAVVRIDWQAEDDVGLSRGRARREAARRARSGGACSRKPEAARRDGGTYDLDLGPERLGEGEPALLLARGGGRRRRLRPEEGRLRDARREGLLRGGAPARRCSRRRGQVFEEMVTLLARPARDARGGRRSRRPTGSSSREQLDVRTRHLHERHARDRARAARATGPGRARSRPRSRTWPAQLRIAEQRVAAARAAGRAGVPDPLHARPRRSSAR